MKHYRMRNDYRVVKADTYAGLLLAFNLAGIAAMYVQVLL